jgi:hypothetical protein
MSYNNSVTLDIEREERRELPRPPLEGEQASTRTARVATSSSFFLGSLLWLISLPFNKEKSVTLFLTLQILGCFGFLLTVGLEVAVDIKGRRRGPHMMFGTRSPLMNSLHASFIASGAILQATGWIGECKDYGKRQSFYVINLVGAYMWLISSLFIVATVGCCDTMEGTWGNGGFSAASSLLVINGHLWADGRWSNEVLPDFTLALSSIALLVTGMLYLYSDLCLIR